MAETICQVVLQFIIVVFYADELKRKHQGENNPLGIIYLSLVTSCIVLVMWTVLLSREANEVGLQLYEYITVILQGSFNFVPYLPAIERGKKELVNWADFRFDSHSVGLVSKALISPDCNLKQIKLSADSLRKLTHHECKFLGQMLADSPKDSVKVCICDLFWESAGNTSFGLNPFESSESEKLPFLNVPGILNFSAEDVLEW